MSSPSSEVISDIFVKLVSVKSESRVNVNVTVSVPPTAKLAIVNRGPAPSVTLALVPASLDTYVKPVGGVSLNITFVAAPVPSFVTTTSKVTVLPGITVPEVVKVLLKAKSYISTHFNPIS